MGQRRARPGACARVHDATYVHGPLAAVCWRLPATGLTVMLCAEAPCAWQLTPPAMLLDRGVRPGSARPPAPTSTHTRWAGGAAIDRTYPSEQRTSGRAAPASIALQASQLHVRRPPLPGRKSRPLGFPVEVADADGREHGERDVNAARDEAVGRGRLNLLFGGRAPALLGGEPLPDEPAHARRWSGTLGGGRCGVCPGG